MNLYVWMLQCFNILTFQQNTKIKCHILSGKAWNNGWYFKLFNIFGIIFLSSIYRLTHWDLGTPYNRNWLGDLRNYWWHIVNRAPKNKLQWKFEYIHFLSRRCILKYCLQIVGHFIHVLKRLSQKSLFCFINTTCFDSFHVAIVISPGIIVNISWRLKAF